MMPDFDELVALLHLRADGVGVRRAGPQVRALGGDAQDIAWLGLGRAHHQSEG